MKYSKTIKVSNHDYDRLNAGLHICIKGVHRFINIKCINESTNDELIATVTQVGGIFNYSAAIRKF